MSSNGALAVCQSGFEGLLAREMEGLGLEVAGSGPGWVLAKPAAPQIAGLLRSAAFPQAILEAPAAVSGDRVNELAKGIAELFAESIRGERIEGAWPCLFAGGQDTVGLGRRVARSRRLSMNSSRKGWGASRSSLRRIGRGWGR